MPVACSSHDPTTHYLPAFLIPDGIETRGGAQCSDPWPKETSTRSWGRTLLHLTTEPETVTDQQRRLGFTDSDLAHLGTAELLDELLARVQEILGVDTVAVLLLDEGGTYLVARSARGLDEEVHQGVRVPVGRGFAGRIAATRAPVALDHVGPDTVVNPILWRKGIQSMLGVPLVAGGALLGVIHVGTLERRVFSDDDNSVLQLAADRIAIAVSVQQAIAERSAARTLQHSLLPTRLPAVAGLEFAARFVAAEEFGVGGDWFDAFKLPDGQIGIAVGDVAGSGLRAAVVMGRIRSVFARVCDRVGRSGRGTRPAESEVRSLRARRHGHRLVHRCRCRPRQLHAFIDRPLATGRRRARP